MSGMRSEGMRSERMRSEGMRSEGPHSQAGPSYSPALPPFGSISSSWEKTPFRPGFTRKTRVLERESRVTDWIMGKTDLHFMALAYTFRNSTHACTHTNITHTHTHRHTHVDTQTLHTDTHTQKITCTQTFTHTHTHTHMQTHT